MKKKKLSILFTPIITLTPIAFTLSCSNSNVDDKRALNEFIGMNPYPIIKFKKEKKFYNLNDFLDNNFQVDKWDIDYSNEEFKDKFNSTLDKISIKFKTYLLPIFNNDLETFLVFEATSKHDNSYKKELFVNVKEMLEKNNKISNFENLNALEIKEAIERDKNESVLIPDIKFLLLSSIEDIGRENILDSLKLESQMKFQLEEILYSKLSMFDDKKYQTLKIKENSFKISQYENNEYKFEFQFSTKGTNEYSTIDIRFSYEK